MSDVRSSAVAQRRSLRAWLFSPFRFVAGGPALLLGLLAIFVTAVLGWLTSTHVDGVLDVHTGTPAPLWLFIGEGLVGWLTLSLSLVAAALLVRGFSFRAIDILGTQALARWPAMLSVALFLITPLKNAVIEATHGLAETPPGQLPHLDAVHVSIVVALGIVMLAVVVWVVLLMYRGYAVSCGLRGPRAILSFIAAVVAAEVISKVVITLVLLPAVRIALTDAAPTG